MNWVIGEIQHYRCGVPWRLKLFKVCRVMLKFQIIHLRHINEVDAEYGIGDAQGSRKLQKKGRPQTETR